LSFVDQLPAVEIPPCFGHCFRLECH
jgi:hypothetical protein